MILQNIKISLCKGKRVVTNSNFHVTSFLEYGKKNIFINAYMYLAILGNQLLSSIFADYISILSKLRRNTALSLQKKAIRLNNQGKTMIAKDSFVPLL